MYMIDNPQELAAVLTLLKVHGLGPVKFKIVHQRLGSFSKVFSLQKDELKRVLEFPGEVINRIVYHKRNLQKSHTKAEMQIREAKRLGAEMVSFYDNEYPRNLLGSNHSVPLLYAKGDFSNLRNDKCCAVVGTRQPSEWTTNQTEIAVRRLVHDGFTIASGLALGVDTVAHTKALEYGGRTIAVLGCGVDVDYPLSNLSLKRRIEQEGVVVSEYPFGTRVRGFTLKKRNKITVGLSRFILIAQTSDKGGSMNAYRAAVEQKRAIGVFIPPEPVSSDFSGNLKITSEKRIPVLKFGSGDSVGFEGVAYQSVLL